MQCYISFTILVHGYYNFCLIFVYFVLHAQYTLGLPKSFEVGCSLSDRARVGIGGLQEQVSVGFCLI